MAAEKTGSRESNAIMLLPKEKKALRLGPRRRWRNCLLSGQKRGRPGVTDLFLDVPPHHLEAVVRDLAWRKFIMDVDRFLGDRRIREAVERTLGREVYKQFQPWLQGIANDRAYDGLDGNPNWGQPMCTEKAAIKSTAKARFSGLDGAIGCTAINCLRARHCQMHQPPLH